MEINNRRNAKPLDIQEGDEVLMKRAVKTNKLSSTFEPTIYKVMKRKGSEVTIESTENSKRYRRNVSHLKKVNGLDLDEMRESKDDKAEDMPITRRSTRRPAHLKDFI